MIKCSNCGADFHKEETKCPYCGQIYIPGAQKDYMKKLYEIRENMADVEELSEEVYHKEIRRNVKKTGVILAAIFLFILCITGLFAGMEKLLIRGENEEDIKARILWERENFPLLNELYEAGDYQGVLRFMENAYQKNGYWCDSWEHYPFISQYENYEMCQRVKEKIQNREEVTEFEAGELLYCGMYLMNFQKENKQYGTKLYNDAQKEILTVWSRETEEIFLLTLDFSGEELVELQGDLFKEGYLSYEACCEQSEMILERIANEM